MSVSVKITNLTAREKFIKLLLDITNYSNNAQEIVTLIMKKMFGILSVVKEDDEIFKFTSLENKQELEAIYNTADYETGPYTITLKITFSNKIEFLCYIDKKSFDDYWTEIEDVSLEDIKEIVKCLQEF